MATYRSISEGIQHYWCLSDTEPSIKDIQFSQFFYRTSRGEGGQGLLDNVGQTREGGLKLPIFAERPWWILIMRKADDLISSDYDFRIILKSERKLVNCRASDEIGEFSVYNLSVGKMSFVNCPFTTCRVGKLSCWRNVVLEKCHIYQKSVGKLSFEKMSVCKLSCWENVDCKIVGIPDYSYIRLLHCSDVWRALVGAVTR